MIPIALSTALPDLNMSPAAASFATFVFLEVVIVMALPFGPTKSGKSRGLSLPSFKNPE